MAMMSGGISSRTMHFLGDGLRHVLGHLADRPRPVAADAFEKIVVGIPDACLWQRSECRPSVSLADEQSSAWPAACGSGCRSGRAEDRGQGALVCLPWSATREVAMRSAYWAVVVTPPGSLPGMAPGGGTFDRHSSYMAMARSNVPPPTRPCRAGCRAASQPLPNRRLWRLPLHAWLTKGRHTRAPCPRSSALPDRQPLPQAAGQADDCSSANDTLGRHSDRCQRQASGIPTTIFSKASAATGRGRSAR